MSQAPKAHPSWICPGCGQPWDKGGPDGFECKRCGFFPRDVLAKQTIAHDDVGANPSTSSPDHFFPKGFAAKRAAETLCQDAHFATGGGQLYVYRGGAYRPDGSAYVCTETTRLLGDRWTSRNAEEVVKYLAATSPALWERPPSDKVNVMNGILDVATGELENHSPFFLSPVQINATYDRSAACPLIDKFISEVFPGDTGPLAFELVGHLMLPDDTLERAFMLLGGGSNGKSTYLFIVRTFLGGSANVAAVPLQTLDSNRFASADLFGKLANIVTDLDAEAVKSSGTFKAIVSGEPIHAEHKYGNPFSFRPFARLVFSANEPPPSHDTTYAFFRRWLIIPFEATFSGKRKDKELRAKLTTASELSGLLNRALDALRRLQERGDFDEPLSLVSAKQEFRTAVDSAASYVVEECFVGPELRVSKPELYRGYKDWCINVNRSPLSARRFNDRVRSMLPNPDQAVVIVNGTEHWNGITFLHLVPADTAASQPAAADQGFEGGEEVEKVDERSIPLLPGEGEEEGIRVGQTSTLSTQPPPGRDHSCPGCGRRMSVVRVGDLCGRCLAAQRTEQR